MSRSLTRGLLCIAPILASGPAHAHGEGGLVAIAGLLCIALLIGVGIAGATAGTRGDDWKSAIVPSLVATLIISIVGGILLAVQTGILFWPLAFAAVGVLLTVMGFLPLYWCARWLRGRSSQH